MKPLLTSKDVQNLLKVTRMTVFKWARTGKIPSIKIAPNTVRFDPDAIESWLKRQLKEDVN